MRLRRVRGKLGDLRLNRPDLFSIMQHSYVCGLPRHWKETRLLIDYIHHLENKLDNKGEDNERTVEQ